MSGELLPFNTQTTTLQAVNVLLRTIGEAQIASLTEGELSADVESAFNTLQSVNREVQAEGWHFNTEVDFPLTPGADGSLTLPLNCLKVDSIEAERHIDVVQRGLKLYDRTNHTFTFKDPVKVTFVQLLSFEEIPEYARRYITVKAARIFSNDEMASDSVHRFKKDDEDEARLHLEKSDAENEDNSAAASPHFLGNWRAGRKNRSWRLPG